jgi:hypothetical protein
MEVAQAEQQQAHPAGGTVARARAANVISTESPLPTV